MTDRQCGNFLWCSVHVKWKSRNRNKKTLASALSVFTDYLLLYGHKSALGQTKIITPCLIIQTCPACLSAYPSDSNIDFLHSVIR
jgi:hypothetical protein